MVELGDTVLVKDNGNLKIMNFATGKRNIGEQIFEVVDRSYDIKSGVVSLTLLGGLGFGVNDRYGAISPSSILDSGCTTTLLRVTPSYGNTTLSKELSKWQAILGYRVIVHSPNWSNQSEATLLGFSTTDPAGITLSAALSFTPSQGDIVEVAPYPNNTNAEDQKLPKLLYAFCSKAIAVTTGTSTTEFYVSSLDAASLVVGTPVLLHKQDWSSILNESNILSVSGTKVTVSSSLGSIPTSDYVVDGVGFLDGSGFYRYD